MFVVMLFIPTGNLPLHELIPWIKDMGGGRQWKVKKPQPAEFFVPSHLHRIVQALRVVHFRRFYKIYGMIDIEYGEPPSNS